MSGVTATGDLPGDRPRDLALEERLTDHEERLQLPSDTQAIERVPAPPPEEHLAVVEDRRLQEALVEADLLGHEEQIADLDVPYGLRFRERGESRVEHVRVPEIGFRCGGGGVSHVCSVYAAECDRATST